MRYFIIAGEASGDLHGSGLVKALHAADPAAQIAAWGGELMESAGAVLHKHYRELAFMGFVEVVWNLPTILGNFKAVKQQILAFNPDVLILIDYPGFNLRMSKWAASQEIPVHYYISPQLWAWKEGRVETVRKFVTRMYVILPFEKEFYAAHNIEVDYVGHPLLEAIQDDPSNGEIAPREQAIALLPGSRAQEIKHSLPIMLKVAERFPDRQFFIAGAPNVPESTYTHHLRKTQIDNVTLHTGATYSILNQVHAAITTSGTATLETALFGVPQVVCYKGNALSFQIAKRLVKVPYISLVNLIANGPVVEELIQENFNAQRVSDALERVLAGPMRETIKQQYGTLRNMLDAGGASQLVAQHIVNSLKSEDGSV